MTVTIKAEDGTEHVADSLPEARKLAAKVKREELRKEKERRECRALACLRSESAAYHLMRRHHSDDLARWSFCQAGSEYPAAELIRNEWGTPIGLRVTTEDGTADIDFYRSDAFIGWIESGGGFCRAVVIRYAGQDTATVHAVGINGPVVCLSDVPGFDTAKCKQGR